MPKKKKNNVLMTSSSEILIYKAEDGQEQIQVKLENNTVWLSQALMAKLFQTTVPNINMHIKNIFKEGELDREATVKKSLIVQQEAAKKVERTIDFYNLEVIIAVGYRVKSHVGTQFRRWATERLSEYLVKGFAMDDERIKSGYTLGAEYFDELIERIRDIRSSERLFYEKIKEKIWV